MLSIRKNLLALLAATLSAIPAIARTTETAHTLLPAPQHIEFHGGDEIGRASGRERVFVDV